MELKIFDIKKLFEKWSAFDYVNILGWVTNNRQSSKSLAFLEVNDGSCFRNLQVVCRQESTSGFDQIKGLEIGSAIQISGNIKYTPDAEQPLELAAKEIIVLATANDYPLQKKEHSLEYLRTIAHVRHRSKLHRAIQLIRHQLSRTIFHFFDQLGFLWVHTPIITGTDSEGAGESFFLKPDRNGQDFFGKQASLSVSGQLHAEAYALGFKNVYTFGPTFRAEKSSTSRHAAEFWMLEPEIHFFTLADNIFLIEKLVKTLFRSVLENCRDEMEYLEKINKKPHLIANLEKLVNSEFKKISYDEAVAILKTAITDGVQFAENDIHNKMDLKTEHERYLAEVAFKAPVFVYNYPKDLKAFYMKVNDDQTTVAATDLLFPGVGEVVGGSERESRIDVLKQRCLDLNIPLDTLTWYLELRKYGYYKSAGFGLGFDRLIMYITGVDNIRDTLPFPRTNQQILF